MPTFITIFGLRFYFYANEHLPIPLHIENGDGRAKIRIEPDIAVIENNGIKPGDIRKAMEVVNLYKEDIVAMWHQFFTE